MKNRKTAVLLGAAALTAALGLGYGLLTGAEQAEESSSAAGVAAFSPTGAVSVICYENEGGEIALEYLDDTWTLRRDADFPVNQTSAESMANYLAPLNATALVTQSGADLVAYGLDEPSNRIEVATDAGETCTVLVGAQNTHTGEYYIKLEGEEPVYTVSESFAAAFTRTERGLQQTENWPVESTDSVTRATLEQGSNTLTVDVSEDADGNKTYTASDTARTETPDTAAAQAFISSAATLYFSSSADFKPTDEALAAYGLAEPSATLTVEWTRTDDASGAQESVTSVLYLGAVDPNGDYYARLADSNAVSTLNATALSGVLGMTLDGMLPELGAVLVIGLGNRRITADSLGPRVVDGVLVTRHMRENTPASLKGRLRAVSAVAPGVLGVTGMETAEVVRGIVEHTRPEAVIAVDALAARETARICTTMQIADTGIQPGSGVGNHRLGLNEESLGVPVIAVGVPMVVYAATIARDALELLMEDLAPDGEEHAGALDALVDRVVARRLGDLVVTPREVDERVTRMADLLALGINRALQPRLDKDEIPALMH